MAILDIRKYPDPVLKTLAEPVPAIDAVVRKLLDDMTETMYAADGVGLAAPQVGILRRVVVIDVSENRKEVLHLINPEIISSSGEVPSEEGCLSIPDFRETLKRNEFVTAQALNAKGEKIEIQADGLLAICLQHEIDHLNGVLFVDRLSRLKREMFKRWHKKRSERE